MHAQNFGAVFHFAPSVSGQEHQLEWTLILDPAGGSEVSLALILTQVEQVHLVTPSADYGSTQFSRGREPRPVVQKEAVQVTGIAREVVAKALHA